MPCPASLLPRLKALGVDASDVEEQFVRGGGPGGQKINKTSSRVHLLHRPTGFEVRCQQSRSQSANREAAWTLLCDKLETAGRLARAAVRQEQEKARRRARPKSRRQKAVQVADKRHRATIKAARARPDSG